jgi:low affinity Fe/Cu permease
MSGKMGFFERFAQWATRWTGSTPALVAAIAIIFLWAITGPLVRPPFNDTWQLIINTGTTIVTFLMVFLIQRAQNKESLAVQLKLNEMVAALEGASNRLINAEDLSEKEVRALHDHYARLVDLARREGDVTCSHSVEEAVSRHQFKVGRRRKKETPLPALAGGDQSSDADSAVQKAAAIDAEVAGAERRGAGEGELQAMAERLQEVIEWHRARVVEHEARLAEINELVGDKKKTSRTNAEQSASHSGEEPRRRSSNSKQK